MYYIKQKMAPSSAHSLFFPYFLYLSREDKSFFGSLHRNPASFLLLLFQKYKKKDFIFLQGLYN